MELGPFGPVEGDRSKPIANALPPSGPDLFTQNNLTDFLGRPTLNFVQSGGSLFATVVPESFPDGFSRNAADERRFETARLGLDIAAAELDEGQTISPLRALQTENNALARMLELANGISFVNNAIIEDAEGPVTLYANLPDQQIDGLPDDRSSPGREPTVFTYEEILDGTWTAQDFRDGDQLVIPAAIANRTLLLAERSAEENVETGSLFNVDGSPVATPEHAAGTAEGGNNEGVDSFRDENGEIIDSIDEEGVILGDATSVGVNDSAFFLNDEDIDQVGAAAHVHPSQVLGYVENLGTFRFNGDLEFLPTAQPAEPSTAADIPETLSEDPVSVASTVGEPESDLADAPVESQADAPDDTERRQRGDRVRNERFRQA